MTERCCPNTTGSVRPGVESAIHRRQVPSDDLSVTNDDDGAPGYPQTVNLHIRVNNEPRDTKLVYLPACELNREGREDEVAPVREVSRAEGSSKLPV